MILDGWQAKQATGTMIPSPGDGAEEMKPTCKACKWYDPWWGTCCNGDSPMRGDTPEPDAVCAGWEKRDERTDKKS